MLNKTLENKPKGAFLAKTANERTYLNSMMPELRQEGYTCVSGCSECCSCGGNDYAPKNR